jgi:S-formylglutathione hydrolase FrmB
MAYINANIYVSEAGKSINVGLVYPDDARLVDNVRDVKGVIWLLHGFYGSGADWLQLSAAARYAYDSGYILICPDAENSFYQNMVYGPPYYDILTKYLPRELERIFKIPADPKKTHIAGLSMGGYGAMRIGLSNPERFATIGSFSGALDIALLAGAAMQIPEARGLFTPIFGETLNLADDSNLLKLAPKQAEASKRAGQRILITCGKQDELGHHIQTQNKNFLAVAKNTCLDLEYREWDGVHEWAVWDRSLAEFIGFIEKR